MKIYLLSLLFVIFSLPLFSQECGDCSRPIVALYDLEMRVERPQSDSAILNWMGLFWVGPRARYMIRQNEPSPGCITWLDGAMINANQLQDGVLKYGHTYTNLPPAGELDCDYALSGYVGPSGDKYEAVLTLETGASRELVKSVSVQFENTLSGPDNAGTQLAGQFGSILDVIRNFEVHKRDTDNKVAIRNLFRGGQPDEVQVKPARTKVSAGDTVDVDIQMTDCDGVALKGRKLHLAAFSEDGDSFDGPQNGSFTQTEAVTDEQGIAKTRFVPAQPGLAVLKVNFLHKKPTGRRDLWVGTAYLNVPKETYEMEGIWSFGNTTSGDTSWTKSFETAFFSFNSHTSENTKAYFRIKALLERDYSIPMIKVYNKILSVTPVGSYSFRRDFFKDFCVTAGGTTGRNILIEKENISGKIVQSGFTADITFPYQSDAEPDVSMYSDISRKGLSNSRNFSTDNGWSNSSFDLSDTAGAFSMDFNSSNMEDKSVVRSGNSYSYKYKIVTDYAQNTKDDYHGHTLYTNETEDWYIKISSGDATNDVKEKYDARIPADFTLSQNYPNPFNPVTVIKYQIPVQGHIRLSIYDQLGSKVYTLIDAVKQPGNYQVTFDGSGLSSGIYFYRMECGSFIQTKKLALIK